PRLEARHVVDRGETALDDQAAKLRMFRREVDRDRGAERMSVDVDVARIKFPAHELVKRRLGVLVDRRFRRELAIALAVAPVVDREHREAELAQERGLAYAGADIAVVAVKVEDQLAVGARPRHPPCMQLLAAHWNGEVGGRKAELSRRDDEVALRL